MVHKSNLSDLLAASVINAWLRYWMYYVIINKKWQFHDNSNESLTLIQYTMAVSSDLVKQNSKPAPKKRFGWPALNNTSSSLDTSLSPERPKKLSSYTRFYVILDMTNMNTGLLVEKIDQDVFSVKKTWGWLLKMWRRSWFDKRQELFQKFFWRIWLLKLVFWSIVDFDVMQWFYIDNW